ncbi:hypothetical protein HW49_06525 [Porphyromonadaceae bacterium COT-184 OH4590]|nr:hypothetical protein HW49_06525 [Porphyromonadaceae bacterium COT-184 OH4590]
MDCILHIFSNIIFSKGEKRSLLLDLQHNKFYFAPNSMEAFAKGCEGKTKTEIFASFSEEEHPIVEEYIDFLQKNMIAAFLPKEAIKNFTAISKKYESPYLFENVILDVDSNFDYKIIYKLDEISIPYIQIRFYNKIDYQLLQIIEELSFVSVEIVVRFGEFDKSALEKYKKVAYLYVYQSPVEEQKKENNKTYYFKNNQTFECIGKVTKHTFSINAPHVFLSLQYNSCLYKKLYIGTNGEIRNCPATEKFGNILDLTVEEVCQLSLDKHFTQMWHITKDQIEECKDCEFRYICTDCRCFITDKSNIYSKPKNCKYNPYAAEWKE